MTLASGTRPAGADPVCLLFFHGALRDSRPCPAWNSRWNWPAACSFFVTNSCVVIPMAHRALNIREVSPKPFFSPHGNARPDRPIGSVARFLCPPELSMIGGRRIPHGRQEN
jgi:hypothetical protein